MPLWENADKLHYFEPGRLSVSAVFQAQCLSFFFISDVVLPLRLRLGLAAAAKVVTLLGYTSHGTFVFFLIFAHPKSLVFYLPQVTL